MILTEQDRETAVHILKKRLRPASLRKCLPGSIESLVASTEKKAGRRVKVKDDELADIILDLYGIDLFAGRPMRFMLCCSATESEIEKLYEYNGNEYKKMSLRAASKEISERTWHNGKAWPRFFVRQLGFPKIFAGFEGEKSGAPWEDIEPHIPLPELHKYQKKVLDAILNTLCEKPGVNRAIVTLPTGSGKTRTTVESLIVATQNGIIKNNYILWIAQSEELCEQAVQAFREVWVDRGTRDDVLRIYRLWGTGRPVPDPLGRGIIIASIQKLFQVASVDGKRDELVDLSNELGAIVIDEAHRSPTTSYSKVMEALGIDFRKRGKNDCPVIGLTATPYRGFSDNENKRLAGRYHKRLIKPWSSKKNLAEKLQKDKILAKPTHQTLITNRTFTMTRDETLKMESFKEFPDSFIEKIGKDSLRNIRIINRIAELDPSWPVLFFGCSVEHATAMSLLLTRKGVPSAVVTGETRSATRRYLIKQFKEGKLRVLCNYGVLTTGFDAPKVRVVVIARPTTSPVLYEQMIGRGMRGPLNGGTEECLIIDVEDNITRFGGNILSSCIRDFWVTKK